VTRLYYVQRVHLEQMISLGIFMEVFMEHLDAEVCNTMVLKCAIECMERPGVELRGQQLFKGEI